MLNLDTPCKNCIFAKYNGITQYGCKLDKLDIFRKHDTYISEAYDEDKEFYVIKNRTCIEFRTTRWKHINEPLWDQKDRLRQENEIRYQAIIIVNDNLQDTLTTLDSLVNQSIPPRYITKSI